MYYRVFNTGLAIHHKCVIAMHIWGKKVMKIIFHSVIVMWFYGENLNGKQ